MAVFMMALVLTMLVRASDAETVVTVTQETNLPATIEVAAGYVTFLNGTWEAAHIVVGDNKDVEFYIGEKGSRLRFVRLGTYQYTVHFSRRNPHTTQGYGDREMKSPKPDAPMTMVTP